MSSIDLYINAVESINTVAMLNSMFTFALIVAICGVGGAFIVRGWDLMMEGLSYLDSIDFWWMAHDDTNETNPEPCVVTPEMMEQQDREFKPYGDIIRAAMANSKPRPTTISLNNVLGKMDMEYCIAGWFDELPEIMTMEDFEATDVLTDEEFWMDFEEAELEQYVDDLDLEDYWDGQLDLADIAQRRDELEYLMEVPEPVTLLSQEDEWMDELMDRLYPANTTSSFAKYMRIC